MIAKGRKLTDWLDSYLEYTENSEPPFLYRLWTGISTIAGFLERKCYLKWNPYLTWYTNFYVILVGKSGTRKSQAIKQGLHFLKFLDLTLAPKSVTMERLLEKLYEISMDIDKEERHASLTGFVDELATFVRFRDEDMIMALTSLYDCDDDWLRETKMSGKYPIENLWLNLLGGMTLGTVQETLTGLAVAGGLTGRVIFVYAGGKGRRCSNPTLTEKEKKILADLEHDAYRIHQLKGEFTYSKGFFRLYDEWYKTSDDQVPSTLERNAAFEGYLSRRASFIWKISMILSASRGDTLRLEKKDFLKAVRILNETEAVMHTALEGDEGIGSAKFAIASVGKYVGYLGKTTYTDLVKALSELRLESIEEALTRLQLTKYINIITPADSNFPGDRIIEWAGGEQGLRDFKIKKRR